MPGISGLECVKLFSKNEVCQKRVGLVSNFIQVKSFKSLTNNDNLWGHIVHFLFDFIVQTSSNFWLKWEMPNSRLLEGNLGVPQARGENQSKLRFEIDSVQ